MTITPRTVHKSPDGQTTQRPESDEPGDSAAKTRVTARTEPSSFSPAAPDEETPNQGKEDEPSNDFENVDSASENVVGTELTASTAVWTEIVSESNDPYAGTERCPRNNNWAISPHTNVFGPSNHDFSANETVLAGHHDAKTDDNSNSKKKRRVIRFADGVESRDIPDRYDPEYQDDPELQAGPSEAATRFRRHFTTVSSAKQPKKDMHTSETSHARRQCLANNACGAFLPYKSFLCEHLHTSNDPMAQHVRTKARGHR